MVNRLVLNLRYITYTEQSKFLGTQDRLESPIFARNPFIRDTRRPARDNSRDDDEDENVCFKLEEMSRPVDIAGTRAADKDPLAQCVRRNKRDYVAKAGPSTYANETTVGPLEMRKDETISYVYTTLTKEAS